MARLTGILAPIQFEGDNLPRFGFPPSQFPLDLLVANELTLSFVPNVEQRLLKCPRSPYKSPCEFSVDSGAPKLGPSRLDTTLRLPLPSARRDRLSSALLLLLVARR